MTPQQRIKTAILIDALRNEDFSIGNNVITYESVEKIYDDIMDFNDEHRDILQECQEEFRSGYDCSTDIGRDFSRHYESRSVAKKLPDGTWIGWTYWYGGGKHGEPWDVEWMEDAYFLDMKEEERVVLVREFKKKGK